MNKQHKISYISHTHWDREWYRSSSEFKVRLYATVRKVIETLEIDAEFMCFTFDGQYQMIEECLEIDNSLQERIKDLVQKGRILIGPWYIQPDMNLVDGESIANNLRIGIQNTNEKFGNSMNVLWNPDTFFQSPNTPFFVKEFNLKGVYAWRNFAPDNLSDFTYIWQGVDGSKVKAITFPIGYGYFRYLDENSHTNVKVQSDFIKQIKDMYPEHHNDIFLMGGSDHATIQTSTPQLLQEMNDINDKYEYIQSTPEEYLDSCDFTNVPTFVGQPVSYRGGRIHPGIGASRMDIKQANLKQQLMISKQLSPIIAIVNSVGGMENELLIDYIWKNLLKNQFHDSIYSSSPEKVNNEILNRYELNQQMIDEAIYLCARYLVKNNIEHEQEIDEYIVVFNTLPYSRKTDVAVNVKSKHKNISVIANNTPLVFTYNSNVVDYESKDYSGLKSLAGKYQIDHESGVEFGEKFEHTITLKNVELPAMSYQILKVDESELMFEPIEQAGSLITLDNDEIVIDGIKNFIKLENIVDLGDSYNFSTNHNEKAKVVNLKWYQQNNKYISELTNDAQDALVALWEQDNQLKIEVKLNNKTTNNLASLVFDFENEVTSKTNLHYAHVTNDNFEQYRDVDWKNEGLKEKPLPIYLCSRYIEVNEKYTIITNDISQYYQNNGKIKCTLLRSYGRMGEIDLEYRPGRASGYVLDTPSSQQQKEFTYKFTVDFNSMKPKQVNDNLIEPIAKFIVPTINNSKKQLASTKSLFDDLNDHVLFESFKSIAEGYVIRISNPSENVETLNVKQFKTVYQSNLLEEKLNEISDDVIELKPQCATTLILELNK